MSLSSERWKQRAEACRQTDRAEIADAPDTVPGYVPYAADLLDALAYERKLDEIEWECVGRL